METQKPVDFWDTNSQKTKGGNTSNMILGTRAKADTDSGIEETGGRRG
jgi:hypothetical protein